MAEPIMVDVWFDAACPFAWATSRWLLEVAESRPLEITWRPMSLAVLNEGQEQTGTHGERIATSRRAGRLLAAVDQKSGSEALGKLYTALGHRLHILDEQLSTQLAADALEECHLDPALATVIDDSSWDTAVAELHRASQKAIGTESGSPIVAFDGHAFFGPVLTSIPHGVEGLVLFDGVVSLSRSPAFSELTRPRSGPPTFE